MSQIDFENLIFVVKNKIDLYYSIHRENNTHEDDYNLYMLNESLIKQINDIYLEKVNSNNYEIKFIKNNHANNIIYVFNTYFHDKENLKEISFEEYVLLEQYLKYIDFHILVRIKTIKELKQVSRKIKGINISGYKLGKVDVNLINEFNELLEIDVSNTGIKKFVFPYNSLRKLNASKNDYLDEIQINTEIEYLNISETRIRIESLLCFESLKTLKYIGGDRFKYSYLIFLKNIINLDILIDLDRIKEFKLSDHFTRIENLTIISDLNCFIGDLKSLKHLNIKNKYSNVNINCPYLTSLVINGAIKKINCPNLTSLVINDCNSDIEFAPIETFLNLEIILDMYEYFNFELLNNFKKIKKLSINGFTNYIFKDLDMLEELNISGYKYEDRHEIETEFINQHISHDKINITISFTSSMFGILPSLKRLSLKNVHLEEGSIEQYKNLTELLLEKIDNKISYNIISDFNDLKILKIIGCNFKNDERQTFIKEDFINLTSLEHLELIDLNIPREFNIKDKLNYDLNEDVFFYLTNIKTLKLISCMYISDSAKLFSRLSMLETLYICGGFENLNVNCLPNLKFLYIDLWYGYYRKLKIMGLNNLEHLELYYYGDITKDTITNLDNLKYLKISNWRLTSVDTFDHLNSLYYICSEYPLTELKEHLLEKNIYLHEVKKEVIYKFY